MSRCVIILQTAHASKIVIDDFYSPHEPKSEHTQAEALEKALCNAGLDEFGVSSTSIMPETRLTHFLTTRQPEIMEKVCAIIPFEPFTEDSLYGISSRYIKTLNTIWSRLDTSSPFSEIIPCHRGIRSARISIKDPDILPRLASTLGNQSFLNARFRLIQIPAAKCLLNLLGSHLEVGKSPGVVDTASGLNREGSATTDQNGHPARVRRHGRWNYNQESILIDLGIRMENGKVAVYDINNPNRIAYSG